MLKRIISIVLVMMLVLLMSVVAFGVETEYILDVEDNQEDLAESDELKEWKIQKSILEKEKDRLEAIKDELEERKDKLESEIESGEYEGQELENKLVELEALEVELKLAKADFMESIRERKAKVNPIQNILSNKSKLKLGTPPGIVKNKTPIPIKPIIKRGADVTWLDGVFTITKDDIIIELDLDSNIVTVNNVVVEVNSNASMKNNRMHVPLGFILKTLGLDADQEPETQINEIS